MKRNLFITGTDTEIGKTMVSCLVTAGLNAKYWKPIQAGDEGETDKQFIQKILGPSATFNESYSFKNPLSPNHAAALEDREIDLDHIILPESNRPIVVEGAGGIFVPLNERFMMVDLIKRLNLECIVVARSGLGTLNHTLLTLEALRKKKIGIIGVVLNGEKNSRNKESIERFGAVEVLLELEPLKAINEDIMRNIYLKSKLKEVLDERSHL